MGNGGGGGDGHPVVVSLALQDWIVAAERKIVAAATAPPPSVGILSYAPGKFSALLNPRDASTMNLEAFALMFCADLMQNDSSFRRQNSSDNSKLKDELNLEVPLAMAATLSLCGAGSLVAHRWATSPAAQKKFVVNFWDAFARKKMDVRSAFTFANEVASAESNLDRKGSVNTLTAGGAAAAAAASSDKKMPPEVLKRWVRLARVNYGLPHITYSET